MCESCAVPLDHIMPYKQQNSPESISSLQTPHFLFKYPHFWEWASPISHFAYGYATQQDYYGRWCGTLLHSYCTSTYTEVTVQLLWSSSNATLEYPRRYSNRVAVWVLHGNSSYLTRAAWLLQCRYQCSNCVIGYHIAGHSNLTV